MTHTPMPPPEPLEALPMPLGAIELPIDQQALTARALAVAALRQALAERQLNLPFGPALGAEEEDRSLSLNRFAVQLVTSGIGSDQFTVNGVPWAAVATAPQLLLAAKVDEENDLVWFAGVLTGEEFVSLARGAERSGDQVLLDISSFRGGLDRLLTLVQLLEPAALPRLALSGASGQFKGQVIAVADWLSGQVDGAFQQLFGAQWQPLTQGAFFSGSVAAADPDALALVAIPLGLDGDQLVCGEAAEACIESFVLQMLATGSDPARPDRLVLRLIASIGDDLLPDGLVLTARQGNHKQRQTASGSTLIELVFQASPDLIEVSLSYPGGSDLVLPPLQLPG